MEHRVLPLWITCRALRVSPGCSSPGTESGCRAGCRGNEPVEVDARGASAWRGMGGASLGGGQQSPWVQRCKHSHQVFAGGVLGWVQRAQGAAA